MNEILGFIAELIGKVLGQFPFWIVLPIAFVLVLGLWIAWMMFVNPFTSEIMDRWLDRRRREKELTHGKK